jgi:hypothetical protein
MISLTMRIRHPGLAFLGLSVIPTAAFAQPVPKAGTATPSPAPVVSFSPTVRVTIQTDSTTPAKFLARGFDLRVESGAPATTEVELVKRAGPFTGVLVALSASGTVAPAGIIEVLDTLGRPTITFRLTDVSIVSDHLSLSAARATAEQSRISQSEALSSLTADFQEASRQLAMAEALDKTHVNTKLELARARDHVADLQRRIDLLGQRRALLASQAAEQGPLDETIVLRFRQLDIETGEPGGTASVGIGAKPPSR